MQRPASVARPAPYAAVANATNRRLVNEAGAGFAGVFAAELARVVRMDAVAVVGRADAVAVVARTAREDTREVSAYARHGAIVVGDVRLEDVDAVVRACLARLECPRVKKLRPE